MVIKVREDGGDGLPRNTGTQQRIRTGENATLLRCSSAQTQLKLHTGTGMKFAAGIACRVCFWLQRSDTVEIEMGISLSAWLASRRTLPVL